MGLVRNITVALLVLAMVGMPAMACLTPAEPMTMAEHECCRRMSNECQSMSGQAAHSCCRVQARQSSPFVCATPVTVDHGAGVLDTTTAEPVVVLARIDTEIIAISHSPPAVESIVLRI